MVCAGLTWIFGFLAIADARLAFQYLFTVFCSLQGFLIFLLLVARRRQFREQWKTLCCGLHHRTAHGQKVTPTLSNSSSTQLSSSMGSFTSNSRGRSCSSDSTKTLRSFIKRSDSDVSHARLGPQLSNTSTASTHSRPRFS
jgi:G protein-coupled receptor 64/G protein-coupled receptor 126